MPIWEHGRHRWTADSIETQQKKGTHKTISIDYYIKAITRKLLPFRDWTSGSWRHWDSERENVSGIHTIWIQTFGLGEWLRAIQRGEERLPDGIRSVEGKRSRREMHISAIRRPKIKKPSLRDVHLLSAIRLYRTMVREKETEPDIMRGIALNFTWITFLSYIVRGKESLRHLASWKASTRHW